MMKMKKMSFLTLISMGMISGLTAMPVIAAGGDGTLNFSGSVIDAACTVAPESQNMTVDFGTIGSGKLDQYPYMGNERQVKIKLTDCPATITSASLQLMGDTVSAWHVNSLKIDSGAGAANNVAIAFIRGDEVANTPYSVGDLMNYPLTEGDNTIILQAGLVATDGHTVSDITPGTISAVAQYNIIYP